MTTDEVLAECSRRGVRLYLDEGGRPHFAPKEAATTPLLRVLKWHRDAIIERLTPKPPRRWLWRDGQEYVETPENEWLYGHEDRHPTGAWWFRRGEGEWQTVPGRTPLCTLPPVAHAESDTMKEAS